MEQKLVVVKMLLFRAHRPSPLSRLSKFNRFRIAQRNVDHVHVGFVGIRLYNNVFYFTVGVRVQLFVVVNCFLHALRVEVGAVGKVECVLRVERFVALCQMDGTLLGRMLFLRLISRIQMSNVFLVEQALQYVRTKWDQCRQ